MYWGQNIWGKKFAIIAFFIVLITGIFIYYAKKYNPSYNKQEERVEEDTMKITD